MSSDDIQAMIDLYIKAEKDVLAGKTISFRGQTMGMEDLDSIRQGRKEWERRLNANKSGGKGYSLASWS